MSRFDRLAAKWDLNPRRVASAKNSVKHISNIISLKGKDILDYGSGTGLLSFDMSEEASSITAMDNSKGMIEQMQEKIKEANIDNITPVLHDIQKEELPKEKFDIVVSAMTMHHIDDTEMFIRKCSSSLKKDGYLAITDLESEDGTFHTHGNEDVSHFGFEKSEIEKICKNAGLKILYLDTIEKIKKHRDFNIFLVVAKRV